MRNFRERPPSLTLWVTSKPVINRLISVSKTFLSQIFLPQRIVVPLAVFSIVGVAVIGYFCIRVSSIERQTAALASTLTKQRESSDEESSALRNRIVVLESQVSLAQREIHEQRRRRIPWQTVSSSIVAVGVQWQETSGKIGHVWNGTAFGLIDSEWIISAAHVIQWAKKEQENLNRKGLQSQIVVRFPDAAIATVQRITLHPRYHAIDGDSNEPSFDLALFSADSAKSMPRLPLAQHSPEVGEEVFIAGFPIDVAHIRYPVRPEGVFVPTIRCGRVERIVDVGDLAMSSQQNLLQLGIPLVGGFSGSPVVNVDGEVVGIAVFATHRLLNAREEQGARPTLSNTTRILDPAHVSFAVSTILLAELLDEANRESKAVENAQQTLGGPG